MYPQWWGRCKSKAGIHLWLYHSLSMCLLEAGPLHFAWHSSEQNLLSLLLSLSLLLLFYVLARPPKCSTEDIHVPITSLCIHQSIWAGNPSVALVQENTHLLKSERGIVFKNVMIVNASLFIHLQLQLTLQRPALAQSLIILWRWAGLLQLWCSALQLNVFQQPHGGEGKKYSFQFCNDLLTALKHWGEGGGLGRRGEV